LKEHGLKEHGIEALIDSSQIEVNQTEKIIMGLTNFRIAMALAMAGIVSSGAVSVSARPTPLCEVEVGYSKLSFAQNFAETASVI
jgi:hypothetical protein